MINGIINVYKEQGYTSHDVVAKMRGILKMKKIGHTGTLDPDAIGVLPVCMGKGTKLVDLITDTDKTYEAVLKLGVTTDTQDITGSVLKTAEVNVEYEEIEAVIRSYIGEYQQLPPMYSAIKVNGKKLYELARQGKEIERERRKVVIKDIRILGYSKEDQEVRMSVDCGKGTYIRTLLHDIGETLGCGGTMKSLMRTVVGQFKIEEALTLSEIEELVREEKLDSYVIPVDQMFENYKKVVIDREYHKLIYNGNAFLSEHLKKPDYNQDLEENEQNNKNEINQNKYEATEISSETELVRVYDADEVFIGIYRYDKEEIMYKPVKMFLA